MIKVRKLEGMAESLRLYDAVDGGWEGDPAGQEPKSIKDNLAHVGKHIAGVIARKDFFDQGQVRREIAPDGMQYGLRVARWARIPLADVVPGPEDYAAAVRSQERLRLRPVNSDPLASWIAANGILLGEQSHDEDHARTRSEARAWRRENLGPAVRLLVQASCMQANAERFDLEEAFDERIDALRVRFEVPRLEDPTA